MRLLLWNKLQNSLLLRLGGIVAAITLLAVVSMSTSWMVAETTQGNGKAINVAGSLRMQSWRMAAFYQRLQQDPSPAAAEELRLAMTRFEADLGADAIVAVLPADETTPLARAYRQVGSLWRTQLKPGLARPPETFSAPYPGPTDLIPGFVASINDLVNKIEEATEAKITVLRVILGWAVIGTILLVGFSLYLVMNILVHPLRDLLRLADQIGQGDLTARTELAGEDEIGRLGQAFNLMAEDLSKLYHNLEARVEEKTLELTVANRSLELLYHSIARLYGGPVAPETYTTLLKDLENTLGIGHGLACLVEASRHRGHVIASTLDLQGGDVNVCGLMSCAECAAGRSATLHALENGTHLLSLPLMDTEQHYGMLQLQVPKDKELETWQIHLIEALTRHIGIAIGTARRIEQSRRLALLEERAAIARELHDSLAQSLSYMKIQVSRLKPFAEQSGTEVAEVLQELREGLNSAYRQLRELLTTFRLRVDGGGLGAALQATVAEFSNRGNLPIALDVDLGGCTLSANEEIHTLQIVREALSNVLNHAAATEARVRINYGEDGMVCATVEDNGVGIRKKAGAHHYGLAIMEERSKSLGGSVTIDRAEPSGTRVTLRFLPTSRRDTVVPIQPALAR